MGSTSHPKDTQAVAVPDVAAPAAPVPIFGKTDTEDHEQTPLEAISHGDLMPGEHTHPYPISAADNHLLCLTHMTGIPTFPTFAHERRHILTHMAAIFRSWARTGCTEGQSGHISVCDPEFP